MRRCDDATSGVELVVSGVGQLGRDPFTELIQRPREHGDGDTDGDHEAVVDCFLGRELPTVVVSGVYDEELRKRLLRRRVIDFVLKNTPGSLDYIVWLVKRLERNRRISALVVDDSASARMHTASLLETYGYRVVQAPDGDAALRVLERDPTIRLAMIDQEMPGMHGVELTRRLRALRPRDRVAVIGVSGRNDSDLVARFLKSGANDFLRKPYSREEFFCRVSQNVDQLELIGSLQDLATRDFLTGLPNRRHFLEQAERLVPQLREAGRPLAMAILDIDHFKRINDSHGHAAGDAVLQQFAQRLCAAVRETDLVARLGGDEFTILVENASPGTAEAVARKIIDASNAQALDAGGTALLITTSIGIAYATAPVDAVALMAQADAALYAAKKAGRNGYRVHVD